MFPVNEREISRYQGFSAVSLGLPKMAVPALTDGLTCLGTVPAKRRAFTLSKLAEAHVQAGDSRAGLRPGRPGFHGRYSVKRSLEPDGGS